jgi:hypothetical protein
VREDYSATGGYIEQADGTAWMAVYCQCLLFYEYFHGDNGAGIGASHQTGWAGLIATLLHFFGPCRRRIFWKGS